MGSLKKGGKEKKYIYIYFACPQLTVRCFHLTPFSAGVPSEYQRSEPRQRTKGAGDECSHTP